jgi:hypothetical protein
VLYKASGVPHHHIAVIGHRRCGRPAIRQTMLQQFIGSRLMLPQSDRSDGAQSGCIERQKELLIYTENHIDSEFVLPDHGSHLCRRRFRQRPAQRFIECAKGFDL